MVKVYNLGILYKAFAFYTMSGNALYIMCFIYWAINKFIFESYEITTLIYTTN